MGATFTCDWREDGQVCGRIAKSQPIISVESSYVTMPFYSCAHHEADFLDGIRAMARGHDVRS